MLKEDDDESVELDLGGLEFDHLDDGYDYFYFPETLPPAALTWFRWWLGHHPEVPYVTVEAAFTCSKMRPDHFGGAGFFITKDYVRSFGTQEWLDGVRKSSDRGPIEETNKIGMYFHCALCLAEKPANQSPKEWARAQAGFTERGIQVWCNRHDVNILHMDFQGQKHPATTNRAVGEEN